MNTLNELVIALNRSHLELTNVLKRFEVPPVKDDAVPETYVAFLRMVVYLRSLGISEERLRDLWQLERKLMRLLNVDSAGSPTWFLDACGETKHAQRRLLLTNCDLGFPLPVRAVQLGLNFAEVKPELFAGKEMGEDAVRVLRETLKLHRAICADVVLERPVATAANRWARRFK
jgi:hypothetical protein